MCAEFVNVSRSKLKIMFAFFVYTKDKIHIIYYMNIAYIFAVSVQICKGQGSSFLSNLLACFI